MKQSTETGERSKHPSDESENKDPAKASFIISLKDQTERAYQNAIHFFQELSEIKEKCNAVQSEEANVPGLAGDERYFNMQ